MTINYQELKEKYGTPLYVFNENNIINIMREYKKKALNQIILKLMFYMHLRLYQSYIFINYVKKKGFTLMLYQWVRFIPL